MVEASSACTEPWIGSLVLRVILVLRRWSQEDRGFKRITGSSPPLSYLLTLRLAWSEVAAYACHPRTWKGKERES